MRFAELFQRHPAADTDRDGVPTLEEAQAYAEVTRCGQKSGSSGSITALENGAAPKSARSKNPTPTHADVS